jgi:hypothetical protein
MVKYGVNMIVTFLQETLSIVMMPRLSERRWHGATLGNGN